MASTTHTKKSQHTHTLTHKPSATPPTTMQHTVCNLDITWTIIQTTSSTTAPLQTWWTLWDMMVMLVMVMRIMMMMVAVVVSMVVIEWIHVWMAKTNESDDWWMWLRWWWLWNNMAEQHTMPHTHTHLQQCMGTCNAQHTLTHTHTHLQQQQQQQQCNTMYAT